jgi:hypothetical protein
MGSLNIHKKEYKKVTRTVKLPFSTRNCGKQPVIGATRHAIDRASSTDVGK